MGKKFFEEIELFLFDMDQYNLKEKHLIEEEIYEHLLWCIEH